MIELMITIVILGYLAMSAVGMVGVYILNAKLRSVADDLRMGLQTAKTEAIKRNTEIKFAPDATGWVNGWNLWIPAAYTSAGTTDQALQSRSSAVTGITVAVVDAGGNTVSNVYFAGNGRPSTTITSPPTYPVKFQITPTSQACPTATVNSSYTCLNVTITSGGEVNTCNPNSTGIYGC